MSEIKHTPGPWEWVGRDLESNFPGHYESVMETTVSCGQFCYGGSVDLKISAADKRLIAAAPELLTVAHDFEEALKELGQECECGEKDCRTTRLRAAIAKATGA